MLSSSEWASSCHFLNCRGCVMNLTWNRPVYCKADFIVAKIVALTIRDGGGGGGVRLDTILSVLKYNYSSFSYLSISYDNSTIMYLVASLRQLANYKNKLLIQLNYITGTWIILLAHGTWVSLLWIALLETVSQLWSAKGLFLKYLEF